MLNLTQDVTSSHEQLNHFKLQNSTSVFGWAAQKRKNHGVIVTVNGYIIKDLIVAQYSSYFFIVLAYLLAKGLPNVPMPFRLCIRFCQFAAAFSLLTTLFLGLCGISVFLAGITVFLHSVTWPLDGSKTASFSSSEEKSHETSQDKQKTSLKRSATN